MHVHVRNLHWVGHDTVEVQAQVSALHDWVRRVSGGRLVELEVSGLILALAPGDGASRNGLVSSLVSRSDQSLSEILEV